MCFGYFRLFTKYPKGKQYFPKLRDCPVEDLGRNASLIAHARKAMASITDLVGCLDDNLELVHAIQTLARDHKEIGITTAEFKVA